MDKIDHLIGRRREPRLSDQAGEKAKFGDTECFEVLKPEALEPQKGKGMVMDENVDEVQEGFFGGGDGNSLSGEKNLEIALKKGRR